MRRAVVREIDNLVINVVEVEEGGNWKPPDGCYLVDAVNEGSPGDTWDGKKFIRLVLPVSEPVRDLAAEIDALKARVEKLERK